jgi:AcrR family transcriptional regulator
MTDIATAAGLSTGGLYRYFLSKEAVFEALIADLHGALYEASGRTKHDFAKDSYQALYEANLGYLTVYHAHRDVMRGLREAATVDVRFRSFLWQMRKRHVDRFAAAMKRAHGVTVIDGTDATLMAEAMACMVEECAYVWYAHESLNDRQVPLEEAARIVTRTWYRTFFPGDESPARNGDDRTS